MKYKTIDFNSFYQTPEAMPLGALQKGSIDIVGCTVVSQSWPIRGKEWVFRIVSPSQTTPIEIAAQSEEEMVEWISKIRETSQLVNDKVINDNKLVNN